MSENNNDNGRTLTGQPPSKDNFLLRIKKKLSDRHIYSLMICVLAVLVGIAIYFYKEKANYESYLQNTFQEAFYNSSQYIYDVDNLLAKINVTNKPSQRIKIFTDIYREAAAAQSNMGRLPYNQAIMTNILKFLTQMSDFSYAMLIKSADNQEFSEEDIKTIKELSNYSKVLSTKMIQIKQEVNKGNRINWNKIQEEGSKQLEQPLDDKQNKNTKNNQLQATMKNVQTDEKNKTDNTKNTKNSVKEAENPEGHGEKAITGSMRDVQKSFQEYPTLIYDGPFSEHIEQMEPKFLKDKEWIRKEKALEIAKNFLGKDKIKKIEMIFVTDTKEKYVIPVYRFRARLDNSEDYTAIVDITQQGGYPLWMLNYKNLKNTKKKFEITQLGEKVKTFLAEKGYKNMEVNYYEVFDNTVVYNFAYEINGITVYSDLIKVKASLVDGEILGFESLGYLMMHTDREFPQVKITEAQARGEVSNDFEIEAVRLALIPQQTKKEALCYELKGRVNGRQYLVYVNAQNGKHENILEVIKNNNGVFTQ